MDKLYEFGLLFLDVTNILQGIFAFFSLYGIYTFMKDWVPKRIELSVGSFSIRRKHFDVQNITNIVSAKFYNGGQIPPEVRKEIIELTCPKIWKYTKK